MSEAAIHTCEQQRMIPTEKKTRDLWARMMVFTLLKYWVHRCLVSERSGLAVRITWKPHYREATLFQAS